MLASPTVALLGPVLALRDGRPLELGSPTQRTIFAVLAARANRTVSRDELVDAIWGDDAPASALNSVYTYIARLRNSLEPDRARGTRSETLVSDTFGYMLRVAPDGVDVQQFATALATARRLRAENAVRDAVRELEAGLALWRGTPYGGAVGPFAQAERARLSEVRVLALEDGAEMMLELGRPAALAGELAALVHDHPLRERLRYVLMRCYVELGRHADAIREYHNLRGRLIEEEGIEPGSHLQQLYEKVLRGERSGTRPLRRKTAVPSAGRGEPSRTVAQLMRDVPGFTGRTAELEQLHTFVTAAEEAGEPALLLITGGPGAGKTALATRFAHSIAHQYSDGQLHVDLHAHSDRPGHKTIDAALGHLAATLGEPARFERVDARASYRSLLADRRLLILLDNVACAEQVRALLPGTPSCLVIVTSRNGLPGLIARDGARRLVLDGMGEEAAVELFGRIAGEPFVARHRRAVTKLVAACDGLPLALRIAATRIKVAPSPDEALASFDGRNAVDFLQLSGDSEASLNTVIGWSYAALPPKAAQMFLALGRQHDRLLTLPRAAALSGMDAQGCRRALHALADASLVREVAPGRFRLDGLVLAYAQRLAAARIPEQRQPSDRSGRLATITMIEPTTESDRLQMTS